MPPRARDTRHLAHLKAVANRNRFSHRYGIELANATLAAFGQPEEVSAEARVRRRRRRP